MDKTLTHCKNCGNQFEGNFCNQCGQKAGIRRLDWHFIFHNIQHAIFHLDQGILYTAYQMFRRPGKAINEYIAGKRVKYTPPLTYLVIVSVALFFITKLLNTDGVQVFASKGEETMTEFMQHYNDKIQLVVIIPLSVLFTNLFFPHNHYNFFELFAFHCYLRAQFFIMQIVVALADRILVAFEIFLHPTTLFIISLSVNISLMGWAFSQFLGEKKIWTCLLKTLALFAIIMAIASLLSYMIGLILAGRGLV